MNRLDRLSENHLLATLDELESELNQLKTAKQFVGGYSLIFFPSDTGARFDWTGTLTVPGGGVAPYANLLVTVTMETQPDAFCDLISELYIDGARYTWADYYNNVSPSSYYRVYPLQANVQSRQIRQYKIVVLGAPTHTYAMKFYAVANDKATITVVRTA